MVAKLVSLGGGRSAKLDRQTQALILDELREWSEYKLEPLPGYLAPIARDAGVKLSSLVADHAELLALEARGEAGGAEAEEIADRCSALVEELVVQVQHASKAQIDEYADARAGWIEAG